MEKVYTSDSTPTLFDFKKESSYKGNYVRSECLVEIKRPAFVAPSINQLLENDILIRYLLYKMDLIFNIK